MEKSILTSKITNAVLGEAVAFGSGVLVGVGINMASGDTAEEAVGKELTTGIVSTIATTAAVGVGTVVAGASLPAGAVAGVALASADMYSAVVGKDWGTGRELDDGERVMRGAFALFDLVPGVGYLNDLAKTGKVAGFAGIKATLRESFEAGMEQAAKNVDNFKTVLKNVDDFGKKVVTKIDDFGKQLDNLVTNKVSSLADNVAGKLRHADETLGTAAQNFRLNIGLEPQLIDGFMPTPPSGKLSGLADNIQAFAKNLSGSVDEVVTELPATSQKKRFTRPLNMGMKLLGRLRYVRELRLFQRKLSQSVPKIWIYDLILQIRNSLVLKN